MASQEALPVFNLAEACQAGTRTNDLCGKLFNALPAVETDFPGTGGHHGEAVTYEGLTLHRASKFHRYAGEAITGLMWYTSPILNTSCNFLHQL